MNTLRSLLTTTTRLNPIGYWLAWCLLAWLSARVIADGANLAWRLTNPSSAIPIVYTPPAAALPVAGNTLWQSDLPSQGPAIPLTRLPLTIVGVARGMPLGRSVLILDTSKGQQVVTLGERINDQVRLVDITSEGLILDNRGRQERLPWPQAQPVNSAQIVTIASQPTDAAASSPQGNPANAAAQPVVWPEKAFSARFGEDYPQSLFNDPTPLLRYFQAAPVLEHQQLKGYRLRPGTDASLFEALPLESGDVLTAIEGHAIRESDALILLQQHLSQARPLHVQLQRNGHPITLKVEFSS
ncbi:type II secretion system protein N [Phytohalomonas tamaricis]|uniref:type II secretion system protein N n=1 Tax=Phytohalomonas tamaricis TaxID=2081032 RepID=UPI000D0B6F2A|nr:type II secretion system protein N [Phytohalomonas tamaricis]